MSETSDYIKVETTERLMTMAEIVAAKAAPAASDGSDLPTAADDPFAAADTATTTAHSAASGPGPATPEDEAAARAADPTSPDTVYYVYRLAKNSDPVGLVRAVTTKDGWMRFDRVDENGNWVEDDSIIADMGAADPDNDSSDWSLIEPVGEGEARQVYDQHFASKAKADPSPTATQQSDPASGSATPPTFADVNQQKVAVFIDHAALLSEAQAKTLRALVGDAKHFTAPALFEIPDDAPFVRGLGRKVVFVPSDHPRYPPHTPGGLGGKFRPKIRVSVGGKEVEMVDDVSVPNGPPVSPETVAKIKLLGIDKGLDHIEKGEKARQLLGDARDTEQLYQMNGEYTPARAAMHKRMIDAVFEGHTPKPEGQRTAVFAAGGTASGKSSTFQADPSLLPPDAVKVNADDFKLALPEWDYMKSGDEPDPYAAQALHEESSHLAKLATARALKEGYNVFIDGTGNSGPGKFVGKIEAAHKAGHRIEVLMVDAPTNTAIDRMVARGSNKDSEEYGRYVPIPELKASHRGAVARIPDWIQHPAVSRLSIWRTTRIPPILVATGGAGGQPTIHDPQQWADIIAKPMEEGGQ